MKRSISCSDELLKRSHVNTFYILPGRIESQRTEAHETLLLRMRLTIVWAANQIKAGLASSTKFRYLRILQSTGGMAEDDLAY